MKIDLASLLACNLNLAVNRLSRAGYSVKTKETMPPGRISGSGNKRVLAIKEFKPGMAEIIWSFENYE